MRKRLLFSTSLALIFLFSITASSFAQMFGQEPSERQRTYDVQHISINVNVDLQNKIVDGRVITTITPLSDNLSSFKVDAVGMDVKRVAQVIYKSTDNPSLAEDFTDIKFDYDKKELTIYPQSPLKKDFAFKYLVVYSTVDPEKGLYFISPTETFPNKPYQVWSQGEGEDNRYWFPCYDYPNDMATTEMFVTVEKKYQTLSNGI